MFKSTFYEFMLKALTSRGMFESQANVVMQTIIENNTLPDMETRWHEDIKTYPPNLVQIIWVSVKDHAYKWIEENLPLAWFKPMFQYNNEELTEMGKERTTRNTKLNEEMRED